MLNKKAKSKNVFKKSVSAVLASIMALGSGAAIATFNKTLAVNNNAALKYFNASDVANQTRIMMNGTNFLNKNYWMNAEIAADSVNAGKYTAKLKFTIPGYDSSNLKFYVRDRSDATSGEFVEYKFAGGLNYLYLTNLNPSSYEVHVYNGSLAQQNFVCKSEFSCLVASEIPMDAASYSTQGLINAVGESVLNPKDQSTPLNLYYGKSKASTGTNSKQLVLMFPSVLAPYDASTIKVAFFAQNSDRNGEALNVDHILYDYTNSNGTNLYFVVDPQWGTTAKYEAHFYKDSVASENFICKAVNIPGAGQ